MSNAHNTTQILSYVVKEWISIMLVQYERNLCVVKFAHLKLYIKVSNMSNAIDVGDLLLNHDKRLKRHATHADGSICVVM